MADTYHLLLIVLHMYMQVVSNKAVEVPYGVDVLYSGNTFDFVERDTKKPLLDKR